MSSESRINEPASDLLKMTIQLIRERADREARRAIEAAMAMEKRDPSQWAFDLTTLQWVPLEVSPNA